LKYTADTLPWYLKNGWSLFFYAVMPPIGYLIMFINFRRMPKEIREDQLFWATLFTALWSLKFLPHDNIWSIILAFLMFAFSTFVFIVWLLRKK